MIRPVMSLIQSEINSMQETPHSHIVFVFDGRSETNFRKDLYPEYKANRSETPEDLIIQKRIIYQMLKSMGYPILCIPEYEADDIIGTLNKTTSQNGINHTIFTKDKDLFALIGEHTNIYRGRKHGVYDTQRVIDELGVKPSQVVDYLTFIGDTSDNIDGIPNIGPKSVPKVLKHLTLEQVLDNPSIIEDINNIKNKTKIIDYISNNKEKILLMKKLVTMKDDIELNIKLSDLRKKEPDLERVAQIEQKFGLSQETSYRARQNKM